MMKTDFRVTVLGSRGSMAACRDDCTLFGGDTSCYMVQAGDETIFLDAGSGLCDAPESYPKDTVILLTHLHLDHVMGLGMFPGWMQRERKCSLYVPFCRESKTAKAQLDRLFSPPFWPVTLDVVSDGLEIIPMPDHLEIGPVTVDSMTGCHPGGSMIYRLRYEGKTLVYATDYEHGESSFLQLAEFSSGADLLLYDAQFDEREYEKRKGYGHSTAKKGLELLERSGVKRMLLIHHDPRRSDGDLLKWEEHLADTRVSYAREGQTILL